MERLYRIAGLELSVTMPEDMGYEEPYYLEPFAVNEAAQPHRFLFERRELLPEPEASLRYIGGNDHRDSFACVRDLGDTHSVFVKNAAIPGRVTPPTLLRILGLEHLVAQNRGLILHCAYIAWNGKAILFTAPSGTGKSTQAKLWQTHRGAELINGDRAVIRIEGDRILAEGIPFCGSSGCSKNRSLPLEAIVYLQQAPVTDVKKLRGFAAFAKLWEGAYSEAWTGADRERASETAQTVAARIPIYYMPCTPDERSVEALEETLRKGKLE